MVKILFDTSVLVAAILVKHPHHFPCCSWLEKVKISQIEGFIVTHTLAELFSVISSFPSQPRFSPQRLIQENLKEFQIISLTEYDYYEAIENKDRIQIQDALRKLSIFVRDCKYIWCQGINFDPVILENAYRKCKIQIPWKYYNLRDTRTVFDICKIDLKNFTKPDTHHNALQDCYIQYLALKKALK